MGWCSEWGMVASLHNSEIPNREREHEARILKELMVLYQQGDSAAANELVMMLNRTLARYMYATSLGALNLDDLLQECWLRIHKARGSYRAGEPVMPWVLAIARHVRIDCYRKWQRTSGRETELLDTSDEGRRNPQTSWDTAIAAESLMRLIQVLPESQREVIVMLKVTGMSTQEVALAIGSTPAAVKQKAYRAYQSIRAALGVQEVQDGLLSD